MTPITAQRNTICIKIIIHHLHKNNIMDKRIQKTGVPAAPMPIFNQFNVKAIRIFISAEEFKKKKK